MKTDITKRRMEGVKKADEAHNIKRINLQTALTDKGVKALLEFLDYHYGNDLAGKANDAPESWDKMSFGEQSGFRSGQLSVIHRIRRTLEAHDG